MLNEEQRRDRRTIKPLVWLALAAVLSIAPACEDASPVPTPAPTPAPTTTDDFTGTLGKNGAVAHTFTLAAAGSVTAQLKSLDPDASCAVFKANENVTVGTTIVVTANSTGTLCVRIYDVGKIADPDASFNYDIQVIHP
jgi:hypothetical protein